MRCLLLTMLLAAVWTPNSADACSCVEVSAEAAFNAHAVVFEGRVVQIHRPEDPAGAMVAVLHVVQAWKGVEVEQIEVSTPVANSLCGVSFEPDTSWLVYADRAGDVLTSDICQRTRRIEDASEDIAFLGAGVTPVEITEDDEVEPAVEDEPPARGGCGSCASAPGRPALGGLVSLAFGLLLLRRR